MIGSRRAAVIPSAWPPAESDGRPLSALCAAAVCSAAALTIVCTGRRSGRGRPVAAGTARPSEQRGREKVRRGGWAMGREWLREEIREKKKQKKKKKKNETKTQTKGAAADQTEKREAEGADGEPTAAAHTQTGTTARRGQRSACTVLVGRSHRVVVAAVAQGGCRLDSLGRRSAAWLCAAIRPVCTLCSAFVHSDGSCIVMLCGAMQTVRAAGSRPVTSGSAARSP